ncbi:hypothetical protein [Streptomyces canus]|nr:hypothetical protein [Streptomyces canus]
MEQLAGQEPTSRDRGWPSPSPPAAFGPHRDEEFQQRAESDR